MADLMDQNDGLVHGLDVDMLPMDLDLSNLGPDGNEYTSTSLQPPQMQQQSTSGDAYDVAAGDSNMSGIGAGPLPAGFGMQSQNNNGSTLTEFTKRRNWSQRVLEELKDFLHVLTPDGRVLYVSPSCEQLLGYKPSQLVGRFMMDIVHPDDGGIFVREFNESIASGNPLRFFYRIKKEDGSWAIFESHGHPHLSAEPMNFPNGPQISCRGFFMMSRPYPTKNASLLDSFLEHKIENERLTKRIAELKREEQEEQEQADRDWKAQSSVTPSETPQDQSQGGAANSSTTPNPANYNGMPPPAKPGISTNALTRQNLDEALAASKPDSINDKMARYEGANHIDTIEMLTGLRYRDGERSQGISTGDTSPALIRGDAGIAISADKDTNRSADKKKKLKVADEYVCTDCGTLDSPEWRKGPNGPKTLCNACGCRTYFYRLLRL